MIKLRIVKNYLIIGLLSVLVISGCAGGKSVTTETVSFSDKSERWRTDVSYPLFSSANERIDESCRILNGHISSFVENMLDSLKSAAVKLYSSLEELDMDLPTWKCELIIEDSVFMADARYISVRLKVYSYIGGAHGMTHYHAFNYDVGGRRLLTTEDILKRDSSEAVDRLLAGSFDDRNCFDRQPTVELASAVNISPQAVAFVYDPYVLGPYVCGSYEGVVGRGEIMPYILLKGF